MCRFTHPWGIVGLTLFALVGVNVTASAADSSRLHVLLLIDTASEDLTASVMQDRDAVTRLLESAFEQRTTRLNFLRPALQGKELTADAVLKRLKSLAPEVGRDDAVLVYYSGHGDISSAGKHRFRMKSGPLEREKILAAIADLKPRLSLLLTDCCANYPHSLSAAAKERKPPAFQSKWAAFDQLFFQHQGVVDINGCQLGASSWCADDDEQQPIGGTFTLALTELLARTPNDFGEEFVTWSAFAKSLKTRTNARYETVRKQLFRQLPKKKPTDDGSAESRELRMLWDLLDGQKEQTPHIFGTLAERVVGGIKAMRTGWKFGASTTLSTDNGRPAFLINQVTPGGAAAEAGFRSGDKILSVDAVSFPEDDDGAFASVIGRSTGEVVIEFRRAGKLDRRTVTLQPAMP